MAGHDEHVTRIGAAFARGGKAKKGGLSTEEHDCVLIVRDRSGATTDHVLTDLQARIFAAQPAPVVARDAVLVHWDTNHAPLLARAIRSKWRQGQKGHVETMRWSS